MSFISLAKRLLVKAVLKLHFRSIIDTWLAGNIQLFTRLSFIYTGTVNASYSGSKTLMLFKSIYLKKEDMSKLISGLFIPYQLPISTFPLAFSLKYHFSKIKGISFSDLKTVNTLHSKIYSKHLKIIYSYIYYL